MKTLLVPVDFSESSFRALEYALDLASRSQVEIVVMHSAEKGAILPGLGSGKVEEDKRTAQQKLDGILANINRSDVPVRYIVREGGAVGEIVKAVEEFGVTLVVMGTGGAKNFTKKVFGTTTESVAKEGLCPVLAIPEGAAIRPIEHIVYAADFENGDQVTTMQLLNLKELLNATITFLHIKSESQPDYIDDEYIKDSLVKQFPEAELNFMEIANKDVAEGITKYVQANDTSLLAFTILNRMFWEKIFHSSVTSQLLKTLKIPMLALPENGNLLDLRRQARLERDQL
ncbi:universal stress protein [Pontibacter anaerobius]|uniref:Universal stress protein n=1 Tax=Pontibacter anaerobius TaxID=2993940 RepID=A0ABT3RH27_9BACT|nr:universal stress protein [Pontibacter anaerobius]MCX2740929.1 universal stress protein [Pontibacter anaerobius]